MVHTAQNARGDVLVSFGSGDRGGRAAKRAQGRQGRNLAPGGAVRRLVSEARRGAGTAGRGRRSRQALLREIEQAAANTNRRRQSRISNAQLADLLARVRGR